MPLISKDTKGVFVISATPFDEVGNLDIDSIETMVNFYLDKGVDGLTILGMMGEQQKLTENESIIFVKEVLKNIKNKPCIVGISVNGYYNISELSKKVMDLGASGIMIAPPSNLRTDKQIISYYQNIGEMVDDIPIVLQDYPLGTGVSISPETVLQIFELVPNIKILKHEDWPGLDKISYLRNAEIISKQKMSILCGNGGMYFTEELERGADGSMTGFAFPEMLVCVNKLFKQNKKKLARKIFNAYLPYARYEFQPSLGMSVRKYTLAKRGAIKCSKVRKPSIELNQFTIHEIENLISEQEVEIQNLKELF